MNWTRFLIIFITASLSLARAGEPPLTHPAQDLRFLVVVDTSYSMLSRRPATLGSVEGLIASGFQDQIRPGDKFAVWTVNEQVDSGSFTPRIWDPTLSSTFAQSASLFAGEGGNKARAHLDLLAADLKVLAGLTKKVLVVMFTDGAEKFLGTPFDEMVNTAFEKDALKLRASARPFVVAFIIEEGRLTQGMVYSGHGPLLLPSLSGEAPSPEITVQEAPAPKQPAPAPKPRPKIGLAASEHIPTIERMIQPRPTQSPTVFNFPPGSALPYDETPAPGPLSSKPAPKMAAATAPAATPRAKPASAPAVAKTSPALPAKTTSTSEAMPQTQPAPKPALASPKISAAPEPAAPQTPAPAPQPVQPAPEVTPAAMDDFAATPVNHFSLPQLAWFGVGAASAIAMVFAFLLLRSQRRRHEASLISQSLAGKP